MPEEAITNVQRLIDGFVKKNLPVAADRLYLPAELGGLGMFEIKKIFRHSTAHEFCVRLNCKLTIGDLI